MLQSHYPEPLRSPELHILCALLCRLAPCASLTCYARLLLLLLRRRLPPEGAPVYAALQVVAIHPPALGAHEAKVAAAADAHSAHRRPRLQVLLLGGVRRQQGVLAQGEVCKAPGVGGRLTRVRCDDVGPVPLTRLLPARGSSSRGQQQQLQ